MQCKRRWLPAWQRVELVSLCLDRGMSRREAASWRRVSVATVQYWIGRYRTASESERASGEWAHDRPSTPRRQPGRVSEAVHDRVCEARERTGWGPRLIASELGMAHATVSRCLKRRGISRAPRPAREQVRRFEWPCPGDLLQMDTKRLARFSRPGHAVTGDRYRTSAEKKARVGWEFCHSIIDDHSRLVYTEICPDEQAQTVTGFVERALGFFAEHGITARAVADRQRLGLHPQPQPARTADRARDPAPPDPAPDPETQRQGRALPTDPGPRMGLRPALPQLRRPRRGLADLARALQHPRNHSSLSNRPP